MTMQRTLPLPKPLPTLWHIDLFTGLAGFSIGAESTGRIKTQIACEVDSYCSNFIDNNLDLENAGCVTDFALPQHDNSYTENDLVPVEETGMSSICLEDYYEGVLEMPFVVTGGFPCQDVSSANTSAEGIEGARSSLVNEQIRIISGLMPPFCIFENSERLVSRGLPTILAQLNELGYMVEWETISATAFGYPHYRHRCYIVAYLPDTQVAKKGLKVFDHVRASIPDQPKWKFPLNNPDNCDEVLNLAVVEEPRSIKLRTKRINALGNSIIPDIAKAIFKAIIDIEENGACLGYESPELLEVANIKGGRCLGLSYDMFEKESEIIQLPPSGIMNHGSIMSPQRKCSKLNPNKTQYDGMFSTLLKKDGNNNFTCKSRITRPGKLGGLIGDLMRLGADVGGLNPHFGELFMGYPKDYTRLK